MLGIFKKKTFEDEFSALQADMVDICNEYSKGLADKIFIYAANEGMILAHHFYCINKKILDCHKLNDAGIKTQFDVSIDCQEQVLDVLNEDIQKIQALCEKHNKPVPKLMKLVYEPKTKKFTADYKYENQTTDDVSVFDNDDAWFEEEKAKLEHKEENMLGIFKKKTFEDEFSELQADMVDICNEYSCGVADKIFIYVAYEDLLFAMHFHIINNKILMPGKLNDSELDINFDVSKDCQKQVLDILNDDVKKIKSVCDKYNRPMPTEMRLTYEVKTKKFSAEYKYDPQFTDDMGVSDIANAWFEEEKAKLEHREE